MSTVRRWVAARAPGSARVARQRRRKAPPGVASCCSALRRPVAWRLGRQGVPITPLQQVETDMVHDPMRSYIHRGVSFAAGCGVALAYQGCQPPRRGCGAQRLPRARHICGRCRRGCPGWWWRRACAWRGAGGRGGGVLLPGGMRGGAAAREQGTFLVRVVRPGVRTVHSGDLRSQAGGHTYRSLPRRRDQLHALQPGTYISRLLSRAACLCDCFVGFCAKLWNRRGAISSLRLS